MKEDNETIKIKQDGDVVTVKSLSELEKLAREFLCNLFDRYKTNKQKGDKTNNQQNKKATVVALEGNLGAGKTTFTQICARILGIKEQLTSPTFVIFKRYPINRHNFKNLIHVDAYRLDSGNELSILGFEDLLKDPENLIFIEWPERVSDILPDDILRVQFEFIDETTRKVTLPF